MTSADRSELLTALTAQEKLEWVTPKISLMEAGDTAGGKLTAKLELSKSLGPS